MNVFAAGQDMILYIQTHQKSPTLVYVLKVPYGEDPLLLCFAVVTDQRAVPRSRFVLSGSWLKLKSH